MIEICELMKDLDIHIPTIHLDESIGAMKVLQNFMLLDSRLTNKLKKKAYHRYVDLKERINNLKA
jgi:hypothetical protein